MHIFYNAHLSWLDDEVLSLEARMANVLNQSTLAWWNLQPQHMRVRANMEELLQGQLHPVCIGRVAGLVGAARTVMQVNLTHSPLH